MRSTFILFSFLGVTLAAGLYLSARQAPGAPKSDRETLDLARASADELMATLRGLLSSELAAGGPGGAIAACSSKAQAATQALAKEKGIAIRRVSLRWRNPADEPDAYERTVLEKLERSHAEKQLPLESVEFLTAGTGRELRFMKPITLAPMCTTCHGQPGEVPAEVQAVLREKYPNDTATGYRSGDLRGAISVTIPLGAGL